MDKHKISVYILLFAVLKLLNNRHKHSNTEYMLLLCELYSIHSFYKTPQKTLNQNL